MSEDKTYEIQSYITKKAVDDSFDFPIEETLTRYRIVDKATGKVLDDAQGYGYKTARNAIVAWKWKTRPPEVVAEQNRIKKLVFEWIDAHKSFLRDVDDETFQAAKCGEKFGARDVEAMLKNRGLSFDSFETKHFMKYSREWQPLKYRLKKEAKERERKRRKAENKNDNPKRLHQESKERDNH